MGGGDKRNSIATENKKQSVEHRVYSSKSHSLHVVTIVNEGALLVNYLLREPTPDELRLKAQLKNIPGKHVTISVQAHDFLARKKWIGVDDFDAFKKNYGGLFDKAEEEMSAVEKNYISQHVHPLLQLGLQRKVYLADNRIYYADTAGARANLGIHVVDYVFLPYEHRTDTRIPVAICRFEFYGSGAQYHDATITHSERTKPEMWYALIKLKPFNQNPNPALRGEDVEYVPLNAVYAITDENNELITAADSVLSMRPQLRDSVIQLINRLGGNSTVSQFWANGGGPYECTRPDIQRALKKHGSMTTAQNKAVLQSSEPKPKKHDDRITTWYE